MARLASVLSCLNRISTFTQSTVRLAAMAVVGCVASAAWADSASVQTSVPPSTTPPTDPVNQLFRLDNTPSAAPQGGFWVGTRAMYFGGPDGADSVRWALEGEYGITNQISVGTRTGLIDFVNAGGRDETSFGDILIYGKYNFNQQIKPEIVTLAAQFGVNLPTAKDEVAPLDKGKFGVEALLTAYKSFGQAGPGVLGAYGEIGANLVSTNSDFRWGLAATYEWQKIVATAEFRGQVGKSGQNLIDFTPGVLYRGLKNFELGVGVPIGITNESEDIGVEVLANFTFGK